MYSVLDNFGTDLTKKNYVTNARKISFISW